MDHRADATPGPHPFNRRRSASRMGAVGVAVLVASLAATALTLASRSATARQPAPVAAAGGAGTATARTTVASAGPVEARIAAVGDMSCPPGSPSSLAGCRAAAVSDAIVADRSIDWFLALGDLQYDGGQADYFATAYEPTYGRLKARTIPAPGNHEYVTPGAAGYFGYFGAAAHPQTNGWYSTDVSASWHVIVLNSNCGSVGGCDATSAQYAWLSADLAANTRPCVVAIWHHPLFTSSARGSNTFMRPLWDLLTAAKVDLVLNGHEHNYERFGPQRGDTTADATAPREFIVGTGGINTYAATTVQPNSELRRPGFGFLRLELRAEGYGWRFVPDAASTSFTDAGTAACH